MEQAAQAIDALAPVGLELVEEPVHGVAAMRELHGRVAVRVAIDETAAEHGALGAGWKGEFLSYEAPTYFGMLCASYSPA